MIMRRCIQCLRRLFLGERGTTAIEYAVMLALVLLLCLAAARTLGCSVNNSFSNAVQSLGS